MCPLKAAIVTRNLDIVELIYERSDQVKMNALYIEFAKLNETEEISQM